jgi:hypothetical protein
VEGRIGNLVGFNLRSAINQSRQNLRHFGMRYAVVGFRVFFVFPQTDSKRLRLAQADKRDFVMEPGLFSKQGMTCFSSLWVNSTTLLGFKFMDTLRAKMATSWLSWPRAGYR